MFTKIELNERNKANVVELFNNVYRETIVNDDILVRFLTVINTDFSDNEMSVLVLRYGLNGSARKTLVEAAQELGIPREEIRQMEAKTIRELRHPVRGKYIFGILDEPKECSFHLSSELTETNLSGRTVNSLKRIGITTVVGLLNVKLADLLECRNLGKKSFEEIVNFIKENKDIH